MMRNVPIAIRSCAHCYSTKCVRERERESEPKKTHTDCNEMMAQENIQQRGDKSTTLARSHKYTTRIEITHSVSKKANTQHISRAMRIENKRKNREREEREKKTTTCRSEC